MSLDDVPINGNTKRTWEDLLQLHIDDGDVTKGTPRATTRVGSRTTEATNEGERRDWNESTPTKEFLKKGSRSTRTSVTPTTSPKYANTPSKAHSALKTPPTTNSGAKGARAKTKTLAERDESNGEYRRRKAENEATTTRNEISRQRQMVVPAVNEEDVMSAWRRFKIETERDVREFEVVEASLTRGGETKSSKPTTPTRPIATHDKESIATADAFFIEREAIERAKTELDNERRALAQEKAMFEARRLELENAFRAECEEQRQSLQRDKVKLARETERMLALPTKEERNEVRLLREQLERNESEFTAQQQRAKLTAERLRQQIVDLTNEVNELRVEKRLLEEKSEVASRMKAKSVASPTVVPRRTESAFESTQISPVAATPLPPKRGEYVEAQPKFTRSAPSVHDPVPSVSDKSSLNSTSGMIQEVAHDDGRMERIFANSRRVVKFPNGTIKEMVPSSDGTVSTVYFANGDIKRSYPDDSVEYYYDEVDTWHTTHPACGVEVYHFVSTGQVELHGAHDYKEVLFPEGILRRIYPDGREEDVPYH